MRKNQNKVLVILLSIVIFAFLIVRASKYSVTTVTASELGVNLVSNDSFEGLGAPNSWSYPWILYTNYGYTGSLNQDITTSIDGLSSARLGIGVTGTSPTNVSLVQRYIPTDANSTYTIDFWAKAAQPRNINVLVQDGTGTGIYVHQYFNSTVALSTNWQEYTLTYPATQSLADTFLTFGVGQSTSDVWIDYVYMGIGPRAASPTPTLTPTNIPTNTPTATPTATPTPTPTPDIIAPSVSITSPVNGAKVKRDTDVTIYGSATDNVGVTQVKFYSNGTLLCTDTTSPYSCIWHVPKQVNTNYVLTADALDAAGNVGHSSQVVVQSIK